MGLRKGVDAYAVRITHLDCAPAEKRTAFIDIHSAERGPIKVDHRDDIFGGCQMGSCADLNLAFQHAADHAIDSIGFRNSTDFECLMNAAGLHQFDVDKIG